MILVEMQDKNGGNFPKTPHYVGKRLRAAGWESGWSTGWSGNWTDEAATRATVRVCYGDSPDPDRWRSKYLLYDFEPQTLTVENLSSALERCRWVRDEIGVQAQKHGWRLQFGMYFLPVPTPYYWGVITPDDERWPVLREIESCVDFQGIAAYLYGGSDMARTIDRVKVGVSTIRETAPDLDIFILGNPRKEYKNTDQFHEPTFYKMYLREVAALDIDGYIEWDGNWTGWLSKSGQAALSALIDFTGGSNVDDYVRSKAKAYEAAMRVVNAEKKRGQVRKLLLQVISEAEQSAADFELLDPVEVPERERLIASARSAKADAEADLEKLK